MKDIEHNQPNVEQNNIVLEEGDKVLYGLSGMALHDAMLAYNRSDKSGVRPNSTAYILEEKKKALLKIQKEKNDEQVKKEALLAAEQALFIPTHIPTILTAPEVVGKIDIQEPVKKTKHVPVKNIFENPVMLSTLKEMLSSVYLHRPNPEDFIDIMDDSGYLQEYSKQAIEADIKKLQVNKTLIDMKDEQYGDWFKEKNESNFQHGEMLQLIIIDRINEGWIPDVTAIMTSYVDDLRVGIDSAVQYKKTGYFGMSLDMTISNSEDIVKKKIQKNWDFFISKGRIPTVKYYQDPNDSSVKGMRSMPKFIVGGSRDDLERLTEAYITKNLESISDDPLKYTIIAQIEVQLKKILDFYSSQDHSYGSTLYFAYKQYSQFSLFFEHIKLSVDYDTKKNDPIVQDHLAKNSLYTILNSYTPTIQTQKKD